MKTPVLSGSNIAAGLSPKLWGKIKKKNGLQEAGGRQQERERETEEEKKTGQRPQEGREHGKAGQNPENAFAVTSLPFPQRPLTRGARRAFSLLKPALQGPGARALSLNAFFVGEQWTASEGPHKGLSHSPRLPGRLSHL